jgi:hypothetical protein
MMRQRRVQWAAMEFLLASYKKHKQWVWLKQLLLLLTRMVAVALVVAMLARLVSRNLWSALLGGKATHHYVLLDDSYSMSDRLGATSAFDVAGQVMSRIASGSAQSDFQHKFTLLRYSKAAGASEQSLDFNAEIIDKQFDVRLEERRRTFDVSELSLSPLSALRLAKQLVAGAPQDQNIVYVLSDFRTNEWSAPSEAKEALSQLADAGAEIRLVNCVRAQQSNLGIESIAPTSDTRAAGVPLFVNITVRNFGQQAAKRIQVKVKTTFFDPGKTNTSPEANTGESEELPVVLFDEIAAGETATQRVQVYFPAAGQHVVEASLPDDPVAADNRRYCVIDFPDGEPVLVIDGHPKQRNAFFLTAAFMPGQRANTGVRPEIKPPEFLRDIEPAALAKYRSVYLLDVSRFDPIAVTKLEDYARAGGGIGAFVGPDVNISSWNNSLYKDGKGLMPAPLEREDELLPDLIENKPDINAERHPIFAPLLDEQNPLIRLVNVEKFYRVSATWKPGEKNTSRVIASLRNKSPLAIEQTFGEGHVVCFLTTAAPDWNGWANDPTFVVLALKMQSYLARPPASDREKLVGTSISAEVPADKYRPEVTFVTPGAKAGSRMVVEQNLPLPVGEGRGEGIDPGDSDASKKEGADKKNVDPHPNPLPQGEGTGVTALRSGIYETWRTTTDGKTIIDRVAVNVEPREGDLTMATDADLASKLAPVKLAISHAEDELGTESEASNNFSLPLMALLIGLLLLEQVLSYSASYHPLPSTVRA